MENLLTNGGLTLIFFGALLFVLGLFQGLAIPIFRNSRMGLSAHLTAVQSGMAVMLFGLIWALVVLPPFWAALAEVLLIAGNYFIWLGITLAAVTGASKALPIAGKGFSGNAASELSVTALEVIGVVASLISGVLILYGLAQSIFAAV